MGEGMGTTYITILGDTWDVIAKEVYGDELKADVLMAANPQYLHLMTFSAGVTIYCPPIEDDAGIDLPSWRQ